MSQKIKNALVSLSDKSGIEKLLKVLKKYKVNIISSGGTYKKIKDLGYNCTEVSNYTKFTEMLDGRVKTLHPKIYAGILNKRKNKKHVKQMKKKKFNSIDLIIVNFYPFKETIKKTKSKFKIIENIDIGGPTMVRAAAKNFNDVLVITDKNDYNDLIKEINDNKGNSSLKFRERMASKAFGITAYYDSIISNWFNHKLNINFPEKITFSGEKISQLRYGENPHQKSSIYLSDAFNDNLGLKKISGKSLSYNNYNDIFNALEIISSFKGVGSVIIKHANPSGVSTNKSFLRSFKEAYQSDPISAFGGVVGCNFKIDKKIAKEMSKIFFEVILAKKFDRDAIKILRLKKNLILIDISKFKYRKNNQIRSFDNSFLIQERNNKIFDTENLKYATKLKPNKKDIENAKFAYNVCKFVKSNAIVISSNFSTIGIGAGQPSRVDSCKIAIDKAKKFQLSKLKNSVAASDAFFPFPDGIKKLVKAGVKLIVQPGGSIRDAEAIKEANKARVKMIFTGTRHFNH